MLNLRLREKIMKEDNEIMSNEFLKYVGENYSKIFASFKKADFGKSLTSDLFHDALIKVSDKIKKNGFKLTSPSKSGQSLSSYLFITCQNEVMMEKRLIKITKGKEIIINTDEEFEYLCSDHEYEYLAAQLTYQQDEEYNNEIERLDEDIMYDSIMAFIKKRHIALHCLIFEYYYKLGIGFRRLTKELGYKSYRSVFTIVDKVRKDVIENYKGKNLPHRIKILKKNKDENVGDNE